MGIDGVGVIGLGATGSVVARRLLEQGFEVTVHDREFWKVAVMAAEGARPARIPADAAEPTDLVFVHVSDEIAAEEVLFDCGGVGETLRDGGFVVLTCRTRRAFVRSAAPARQT
jgi:2-hydroxy-3-oxopropionate reductase